MKKLMLIAVCAVASIALATQNAALSQKIVRDPKALEAVLEANAADAEARIAVVESGVTVTNAATAFTAATNSIASLSAAASAGFKVAFSTQLVYVAGSVTNIVDADITH